MQNSTNLQQWWAEMVEALTAEQVAVYGRKSTKNETSSKSLNDQMECCLEQARDSGIPATEAQWMPEQAGHGGDEPWAGFGGSGLAGDTSQKNRTRPVFTEIMLGVINGTIKCIICYSLDRLWRSAILAGIAIDIFKEKNVLVIDRNGFVDVTSAEGRQFVLSNAVQAQGQREHAVIAAPRGVRKSRDKGKMVGNANSLSFRAVGNKSGKVRHIVEEIEVVRRIFRLFDVGEGDGPLSTDKIAQLLYDEGYVWTLDLHDRRSVPRNEHTRMNIYPKQVRACLKDVRYIGKQRHEGQVWDCPAFLYEGKPIVEIELFDRVQAKIGEQAHGSHSAINRNALSGRVRCGLCAQPISVQMNKSSLKDGTKVQRSFWLRRTLRGFNWCTHSLPSVRVDVLDAYINQELALQLLVEIKEKENASEVFAAEANEKRLQRELTKCLDWLENKYPKLVMDAELNADSAYDKKTLTRTASEIKDKIEGLRMELRKLPSNHNRLAATADDLENLANLPPAARRDAIRTLIRWIAVFPSDEAVETRKIRNGKPADNIGTLVFLTCWGACISAQIYRDTTKTQHNGNCHLLRPLPLSQSMGGVGDFPTPEAFYQGLQRSWQGRTYDYNPRDVCPGYTPNEDMKMLEVDMSQDQAA